VNSFAAIKKLEAWIRIKCERLRKE